MIQPISKAVQKQSKTQECTSSGVPGCESVTENRSDAGVELQVVSECDLGDHEGDGLQVERSPFLIHLMQRMQGVIPAAPHNVVKMQSKCKQKILNM